MAKQGIASVRGVGSFFIISPHSPLIPLIPLISLISPTPHSPLPKIYIIGQ
ncbi:MAG: hypothetical protein RMY29_018720 [Nostoc sp. CreGUA01]